MCDQTEDCRVKVDELIQLFQPSLSSQQPNSPQLPVLQQLNRNTQADKASRKLFSKGKVVPVSVDKENKVKHSIPRIHVVPPKLTSKIRGTWTQLLDVPSRIESMRHAKGGSTPLEEDDEDSFLCEGQNTLTTTRHVFGVQAKLQQLGLCSTGMQRHKLDRDKALRPGSPSLGHREAAKCMPSWPGADDLDDGELYLHHF